MLMTTEPGNLLQVQKATSVHSEPQSQKRWRVGFGTKLADSRVIRALENAGYEHYYPLVKEMRPVPKRKLTPSQRSNPFPVLRSVPVPMFPRYMFVRFDLGDGQWRRLFELIGIEGMLCQEDGSRHIPAVVRDEEIAALRAKEISGVIPSSASIKQIVFDIGESVRIRSGVFIGSNAEVFELPDVPIEQLDESKRVLLLVALFNRKTVVELTLGDLEKL